MTQVDLKRTVFFDAHVVWCKDGGLWWLGDAHSICGLSKEHLNTRNNVGLFDVSHMGEVWIEGRCLAAVKRWVTSSVDDDGQAQYVLCNESGGTLDDII